MQKFFLVSILTLLLASFTGCGAGSGSNAGSGSTVTLAWDAPETTDLAGYRIYYRISSGAYTDSDSVDAGNVTTFTVDTLSSGRWCFVATAYDLSGDESNYSNETCTDV